MPKHQVDTLIIHANVFTMAGSGVGALEDGAVAVVGDRIAAVGRTDELLASCEGTEVLDGSKFAVLPGLIDCHVHSPEALLRGVAQDVPDYMERAMAPFSKALTEELNLAGTRLNVLESIKAGTTTMMDYTAPYPGWADFYSSVGVRARLTPTINGLAPGAMARAQGGVYELDDARGRRMLDTALDFEAQWQGAADERITVMMGPQAPDMLSPELLRVVKDEAGRRNLMIHMHVAQGDREIHQMEQRYGIRSVPFLEDLGYLGEQLYAVHLTEATADEVRTLVQHGVSMGVCSGCIGLLDGIVPPAELFRSEGGMVGLGTDSASSNNCISIFNEMKLTALFNKIQSKRPDVVPAWQALRMATIEGARAIGLGDQVGSLEPGKQADLILVDLDQLNLAPVVQSPIRNIVPNLVYSATGHEVDSVMVAGKFLMRGRDVLTADESAIRGDAQAAASEISRRVQADPDHRKLSLLSAMRDGSL